jgi:peptidoglycan/LPS O-acetylase OafA/YrhL
VSRGSRRREAARTAGGSAAPAPVAGAATAPAGAASGRSPTLDLLRGVAVVAMVFVHVSKGFLRMREHWGLGYWVYAPEPAIPSFFLAVSGYSVVMLYRARAPELPPWRPQVRRALQLIGISFCIFTSGYGVAFPDQLVTPGILSGIAVTGLLVSAALRTRRPLATCAAALAAAVALLWVLDARELRILGLNGGYEPLLPHLCYGFTGAVVALLQSGSEGARKALAVAGVLLAVVLILILASVGFDALFYTELGRTHVPRTLPAHHLAEQLGAWLGQGVAHPIRRRFWMVRPPLLLWLMGLLVAVLSLRPWLDRWLASPTGALVSAPAQRLGRHALALYVGHLAALAVLTLAVGRGTRDVSVTLSAVALFVLVCYGAALILDQREAARRSRRQAAPAPTA